jgi:hypothetical protein
MRRRVLFGLLALGLLAVLYALFFMSSDEDEIREKCAALESAVSFPAERPNPALFAIEMKSKLREVLHPQVVTQIPEIGEGLTGLDPLLAGATRIAGNYQSVSVDLEGLTIEGLTDRQATVTARAVATAFPYGGGPDRHERRVRLELEKVDGEWLIVRIEARREQE